MNTLLLAEDPDPGVESLALVRAGEQAAAGKP
jgi:hypothetical protein